MAVGGWIIEILPADYDGMTQITVLDRYANETCVLVETAPAMPLLGDEIWWQAGKVYWDRDRRTLRKIGNSFDPTTVINRYPLEPSRRRHLDHPTTGAHDDR